MTENMTDTRVDMPQPKVITLVSAVPEEVAINEAARTKKTIISRCANQRSH